MRKTRNNYVPAEYGGYMFPKCNIPDIHPGDADKVLTVNESATGIEWKAPTGGGSFIVNIANNGEVLTMDKTWQEIYNALMTKKQCYAWMSYSGNVQMSPLFYAWSNSGAHDYGVGFINTDGSPFEFHTHSASGYPEST